MTYDSTSIETILQCVMFAAIKRSFLFAQLEKVGK